MRRNLSRSSSLHRDPAEALNEPAAHLLHGKSGINRVADIDQKIDTIN